MGKISKIIHNPIRTLLYLVVFLQAIILSACSDSSGKIFIGESAPDINLMSADGTSFSLSQYSGKPVLLYFHMAIG
jgi:cytochrome oxidase Cu insertion factor (SCO1/SenC/PrrC family)